jgi:hypothetical protein
MSVEFEENNNFKNLYAQGNSSHSGSGMVNWLINKNIASSEKGANQILIIIAVICLLLAVYVFTAYGLGMRVFSLKPVVTRSVNLPINFQERFQNKVPAEN